MIIRTTSPTLFAPVTLKQLDDKGALKDIKFDAQFKRLKQSQADALSKDTAAKAKQRAEDIENGVNIDEQLKEQFTDLLSTYMVGWSGVQDEGQNKVPFSTDALFELCEQYNGLLAAIVNAFYAATFNPQVAAHLASKN